MSDDPDKSTLDRRTFFGASIAAGVTLLGTSHMAAAAEAGGSRDHGANSADRAPQQDELLSKSVVEIGRAHV